MTTQPEQPKRANSSNFSENRGNWNNNRGRGGNRSNRSRQNNNSRVQCQLCGRFGHTVLRCYLRFDRSYQGHNATPNHSFTPMNNTFFMNRSCNTFSQAQQQAPLNALMVAPDLNRDTNWYPGSGASTHVTNDFGNFWE